MNLRKECLICGVPVHTARCADCSAAMTRCGCDRGREGSEKPRCMSCARAHRARELEDMERRRREAEAAGEEVSE